LRREEKRKDEKERNIDVRLLWNERF
jgi:hypothetical protein